MIRVKHIRCRRHYCCCVSKLTRGNERRNLLMLETGVSIMRLLFTCKLFSPYYMYPPVYLYWLCWLTHDYHMRLILLIISCLPNSATIHRFTAHSPCWCCLGDLAWVLSRSVVMVIVFSKTYSYTVLLDGRWCIYLSPTGQYLKIMSRSDIRKACQVLWYWMWQAILDPPILTFTWIDVTYLVFGLDSTT